MSRGSKYASRCCLCTSEGTSLCHHHRGSDGPRIRPRTAERAAVVGAGVEVRTSTLPDAGNGLFATIGFSSSDVVTEYAGKTLGRREAHSAPVVSHMAAHGGTYIDGLRAPVRGAGGGSFANDPFTDKRARAKVRLYQPSEGPLVGRLFLKVKPGEHIRPGEEIFLSYGAGGRALQRLA